MILITIQILAVIFFCWTYFSVIKCLSEQINNVAELSVNNASDLVESIRAVNRRNIDISFEIIRLKMEIKELRREKISQEAIETNVPAGVSSCTEQHLESN